MPALYDLAADTEDVSCPARPWCIFFVEAKLNVIFHVDGVGSHFVESVKLHFDHYPFVDGSREYEAAVVISVFANQIDSARREKLRSLLAIEMFLELRPYKF